MAAALRWYDEIADYLLFKRYPVGYDKNKKRTLRRKATNHFKVKDGSLYYSLDGKTEWKKVVRTPEEKRRVLESCHSSTEG